MAFGMDLGRIRISLTANGAWFGIGEAHPAAVAAGTALALKRYKGNRLSEIEPQMSNTYREKAKALLSAASRAQNMNERSRLIDEAIHFHNLATNADGHRNGWINDNCDGAEDQATG